MKDFHTWIADMQNSIEDKSEFIKPSSCGCSPTKKEILTDMELRLKFADMLVPSIKTRDDADNWYAVFTVCVTDAKSVVSDGEAVASYIIQKQWLNANTLEESLGLINKIREFVKDGTLT